MFVSSFVIQLALKDFLECTIVEMDIALKIGQIFYYTFSVWQLPFRPNEKKFFAVNYDHTY
mgnify:CR=1 FL=1